MPASSRLAVFVGALGGRAYLAIAALAAVGAICGLGLAHSWRGKRLA